MTDESYVDDPCPPADPDCRGRVQRRKDREAAILAAALAEFQAAGLTNARLDDIAARAGVAKGTLYLYFQNKEELFKAAVRSLIHPVFEETERKVAGYEGSTEALLRDAIRTMYSEMAAGPAGRELMRLMIAEGHRMPELANFYYEEICARGHGMLKIIIWRGIALGEFRASPAAEFPQLVFAPCQLSMTWRLLFGDDHPLDLARYAEAHADFVLAALRAPGPTATATESRTVD